ncbi:uncharacterized protein LOC131989934 isoform X2 [Centropristis striata]|uniref:uncharacterized protein LOC131989934 isoform X2 n=1 Tax=Centropristis striata TaxID=184440 RepID=UPI0027E126E0|nr:uncharacterized protein LOC131989934 isoform X2 [Centropristis striata]
MGAYLSAYWRRDGMRDKEEIDIKVFIKESTGRITSVDLPNNEFESVTVLQLKEKLEPLTGEPVEEQRLIFEAKQLENDRLLVSYGIHHEATIHLIKKMDVTVFVKCCDRKTIGVHLCDNKFQSVTVLQLKEKIQTLKGDPVDLQRLNFKWDVLEDDALLVSCGIQHKTTIDLILKMFVTVFVKDLTGRNIKIYLRYKEFESVTVLQLKEMMYTLKGVPVDQQRLIFGDKQLEDDALLVSYGIQHKATIDYVLKLRGFDPCVDQGRDRMGDKKGKDREMDLTFFVIKVDGSKITINLHEFQSVTVLQLKKKLEPLTGEPGLLSNRQSALIGQCLCHFS